MKKKALNSNKEKIKVKVPLNAVEFSEVVM